MWRFVVRRTLWSVFLFVTVTFVTYIIFFVAPSDPAEQAAGKSATVEQVEAVRKYLNLDIQMMKDAAPAAPYINSNNRILVSSRISNFTYNDANTYTAWNALVIK